VSLGVPAGERAHVGAALSPVSAPFPFGRFSGRGVDAVLVEVEVVPSALAPRAQRLRVSAGARQFELSDRCAG
jgi:hypothetical protein